MEIYISNLIFWILATILVVGSVLTVTSRKVLRSATWLLFVLLATGGIFLILNYHFLAAVQITVYAGGVMVLFVFSILLTSHAGEGHIPSGRLEQAAGVLAAVAGTALCSWVILRNGVAVYGLLKQEEMDMAVLGRALMGHDKFQYLLPFEAISLFLLACVVGGIMIARKR